MDKKSPVDLSSIKVISDSFFYSTARVAVLVLKPIKGILLGNLLGPRLYGILSIPNPYILIASMLSNIGFNTSVLKLMPGYLQEGRPDLSRMIYRSSAFLTVMLSSLWAALLLVFSPWIAQHLAHEPAALNPIRLYALAIPFLAVNTFFASVYLAVQRGKLGATITFVYGLLNTLLPVAAVLWQRNVTLIVGSLLAAELIAAAIFTFFFHREVLSGFGKTVGPLWRGMRETMSFGFLFFIAGLGWNLINSVDRIMIKYYLPSEQLGFYSMGAQIVTILNVVASTLGFALVPSLTAANDAGDRATFRKLVHNAARFGFIVLMPVAMIVFVLSRDFFSILLPRYGPSTAIVRIVAPITFIDLFCRIGWAALVAHGRGGLSAVAYVAAAVVNAALNMILIPRYGIGGAAVAVLATFVFLAATVLIMAARVTSARIDLRVWLHPLLLAAVYLLVGRLAAGMNEIARIAVVAIGGTALYVAGAFTTRLIRAEDIARLRGFLVSRAAAPHVRLALAVLGVAERISGVFDSKRTGKP
jgi:O-antigen/teichoic acid export membrane protein